jgi:hypothetical protein
MDGKKVITNLVNNKEYKGGYVTTNCNGMGRMTRGIT